MSTPEEIQHRMPASEPLDAAAAIAQLRLAVCCLGAGLLLVSLLLSAFVLKQNRDLAAVTANRQHQLVQLQTQEEPMLSVLKKLAEYSATKPELAAVFARHGLKFSANGTAGQAPAAAQH